MRKLTEFPSDYFWLTFIDRWREELDLPKDADPYKYYNLDWITTVPNCDPHIKNFEMIKDTDDEQVLRTGFEAIVRHKKGAQMPYFEKFETDTIEKCWHLSLNIPGMSGVTSNPVIISLPVCLK